MDGSNQLVVLKINQINGISDEIVIGVNDDSTALAVKFAEKHKLGDSVVGKLANHIEQYRQNARRNAAAGGMGQPQSPPPQNNYREYNQEYPGSPNPFSPPRSGETGRAHDAERPAAPVTRVVAAVPAPAAENTQAESEAAFRRAQTNWAPNSAASAKNAKLLSTLDLASSQRSVDSSQQQPDEQEQDQYESMMQQLEQSRQQSMVVGTGGNGARGSQSQGKGKGNSDLYNRLYAEAAKAKERAAALKRQVAREHEHSVQSTQFKHTTGFLSYSPSLAHRSVSAGRLENKRRARSSQGEGQDDLAADHDSVAPQDEFHQDLYERDLRWAQKRDQKCEQIRLEREMSRQQAEQAAHTHRPVLATTPSRQLLHRHGNVEDLFHALYSNKDIYSQRAADLKKRLEESRSEEAYHIPKIDPRSDAMAQQRRLRMSGGDFEADLSSFAAAAAAPGASPPVSAAERLAFGLDQSPDDNVSPLSSRPDTPNSSQAGRGSGKRSTLEPDTHAWTDERDKQLFDAAAAAMEGAQNILARDPAQFVPLRNQQQQSPFNHGAPTSSSSGSTVLGTPTNLRVNTAMPGKGRTPKVFSPNPASAAANRSSSSNNGSLSYSRSGVSTAGAAESNTPVRSPGAFGGGPADRMDIPSPNYGSATKRRSSSMSSSASNGANKTAAAQPAQSSTVEDIDMVGPVESEGQMASPVSPVSFADGQDNNDLSTMGSNGGGTASANAHNAANVRSESGYMAPASDPPKELYLHNYHSGAFSNPHTPSAGSTPMLASDMKESRVVPSSGSRNNTPRSGLSRQNSAGSGAGFGSGTRQRPQSANSGVSGASTRGRTLLRGGGSTCAGPNTSPSRRPSGAGSSGGGSYRQRPLSANGRLTGRTSYPPPSAMGAPASRSRSISAASVRSAGTARSRSSNVFDALYEQRKNHEFVLEEARRKHTPSHTHKPTLVSSSAHRPSTPNSLPSGAAPATIRSAEGTETDGQSASASGQGGGGGGGVAAQKEEFFQRLYDHRLKKAELQEEQFRIIRSQELGRNPGIRASYNNQHHPNVQVDTGVIEPEAAHRMVQRLGVRDIKARQDRRVMSDLQAQRRYMEKNHKLYTNKKSDSMARSHRQAALKEIFECLLYSVYLVKEEEAKKKAQEGEVGMDVHGEEMITEVPADLAASAARLPQPKPLSTSLNINKVYSDVTGKWYDDHAASEGVDAKDENADQNVSSGALSVGASRPSTPSGKQPKDKMFDAATRLLDSARARPDLLKNSVTQQVVGSILQFVSPKLIGLQEFVGLVEEFMTQRLGPPVNMVLGIPEKSVTGPKKVALSSEELRVQACTGQPVLLAKKTTEKIVARKWQPPPATGDSQPCAEPARNQSLGSEGVTDCGSAASAAGGAPPIKQSGEETNILFRLQKYNDSKQRKKAELEERDYQQYANTCTFQPFLISQAPTRVKQAVRRDERKHTRLVSLEEQSSTPFIAGEAVSEVINPSAKGRASFTGNFSIGMKQCTVNKSYAGSKPSGALVAAKYVNSNPQPPVHVSNFATTIKPMSGITRSIDSLPPGDGLSANVNTSRRRRASGPPGPSRHSLDSCGDSVATSTATVNSGRYAQQPRSSRSQASSASNQKYNYSQPQLNSYLAMFDQSCSNPDMPMPVYGMTNQ